jgi:endonuclease YncB( thermonuclease family)
VTAGDETPQGTYRKSTRAEVHNSSSPILPAGSEPLAFPPPSQTSRWRSFRGFPILGQIGIGFGVALAALLGVGIVGAIAAGPKPQETPAALAATELTQPATTSTTVPSTTIAPTTLPTTSVVETVPAIVVPVTEAAVALTAEVVDGDTISVSDGSTVRLIGIDTPESGECGFEEASAALVGLIDGQNVTLVPGARDDVDKYGRLLRYVEVGGVDVDLKMIESGHAIARYDGRDGYGTHPRQDAYVQADDLTASSNVCAAATPVLAPVAVVPVAVVPFADVPVATAPPEPTPAPTSIRYQNCDAVRAAGAAPIHAGDPGWQSKFDRDGDGVGCE